MNAIPGPAELLAPWYRLWHEVYALVNPSFSLAPQVLTQPILPGWLFANNINVTEENSGSPEMERSIVSKYSYGRQLGWIVDVLGELIDNWPGAVPDHPSVQQFAKLRDGIEKVKERQIAQAISDLADLKDRNRAVYDRLAPRLRKILEAGPADVP